MKRAIYNALMLLSLLFSVTIAVFWVRSHHHSEDAVYYATWADSNRIWYGFIQSSCGIVRLQSGVVAFIPASQVWIVRSRIIYDYDTESQVFQSSLDAFGGVKFAGFRFQHFYQDYSVCLPHWFLMPLFLLLPIREVARWRRTRRRRAKGLCPQCGYDLRASPDRCPECGLAVPPAVSA